MSQHILVVDDDKQIARLVRSYLEQSNYQVSVAYDGDSAMHIIRSQKPDLVVLDLMLPGTDGWEVTRIMRGDETLARIPVIMLTARVEDTDKIVGLELGADDYIAKPFNPHEVVARVRAVLRRTASSLPRNNILQIGPIRLDANQHTLMLADTPIDLTRTEFALLHLLLKYPDRAFTRTDMIQQALGYSYEGMERTIDSHIKNLRKKLGITKDTPGYIETVYGVGYRLVGES